MKNILKKSAPYLLIVISFILISFIYFYPVLQGEVMSQGDVNHAFGTANELIKYEESTGEFAQWTNSIFGGMPAYNIKGGKHFNIFRYCNIVVKLNLPYYSVAVLFVYLIGFFILLSSFKIDKWLSFIGSIAFALSSYNIIIIVAGHITKAYAIGFMAPALAGVIMLYNKKYIAGGIVTALSLGMQLASTHPQISYYTLILLGVVALTYFFINLKSKQLKHFFIASGIIALAGAFAFMGNITQAWTNYEYQKYSIRGGASDTEGETQSSGLDKDYALAWSYGVGESFTFLIPNTKGGESGYLASNKIAKEVASGDMKDAVLQQNQYWGDQPFTSGPVYFGAIIMFLFIVSFFIVDNKLKWGLLAATILSILLSFGKNMEWFTDIFFYYVPLYNKFRTVSMTLVIASVTIPFMAIWGLKEFIQKPEMIKTKKRDFIIAFGLTGGLSLIFWLMPSVFFNFLSAEEANYFSDLSSQSGDYAAQINVFLSELENVRIAIFKADAIRSFGFIVLAAISLVLFGLGKIKKEIFLVLIGLFVTLDLWFVDRRYLNEDDFSKKSKAKEVFAKSNADEIILKDSDPNFRVVNLNYRLDADGYTSYHHKTISGYHGAKMKRYQDIIDEYLTPSLNAIINSFQDTTANVYEVLDYLQVFNMLNTKYIIYNPDEFPIANFSAFGNAWFVEKYNFVETSDEELSKLGEVNLKRTAIINKNTFADYINKLPELKLTNLDTGAIVLTDYKPDELTYKSISEKDEFAVFSEIYYPKGWKVYVDGDEVEHICVNYILRGLYIPKGEHEIKFIFRPKSYYTGSKIAFASSILFILISLGLIGWVVYQKKKKGDFSSIK